MEQKTEIKVDQTGLSMDQTGLSMEKIELLRTAKFVKFLTNEFTGGIAKSDFTYKEGLNVDSVPFSADDFKGGLYFCSINDVSRYLMYNHTYIARVDIPLDAKTATIRGNVKADKILISCISRIEDAIEFLDIHVICNMVRRNYYSYTDLYYRILNKIRNDMGLTSVTSKDTPNIDLDKEIFQSAGKVRTINNNLYVVMYIFSKMLREILPEQSEDFYDLVSEIEYGLNSIPRPTEKQIRKIIYKTGYRLHSSEQDKIPENILEEYVGRYPSEFTNVTNPTYKVCLAACEASNENVGNLVSMYKDNKNLSYDEKVLLWTRMIEKDPRNLQFLDEKLNDKDIKKLAEMATSGYFECGENAGIKLANYPEKYIAYLEENRQNTEMLKIRLLAGLKTLKEVPMLEEFMSLGAIFGSFIRWMMVEIIDNNSVPSVEKVFKFLEHSDIDVKLYSVRNLYNALVKIREANGYVEFNPISDYCGDGDKIPINERKTVASYGEIMKLEQERKEKNMPMKATDYALDEHCVYMVWIPCSKVSSGFVRYDILCGGTGVRNDFTVNATYVKEGHVFNVWYRHLKEKLIVSCDDMSLYDKGLGLHLKKIYRIRKLQECGFALDDRYKFSFENLIAVYEKSELGLQRVRRFKDKKLCRDKYVSAADNKIMNLYQEVDIGDDEYVLMLPRAANSSFRRLVSDTSMPSIGTLLGPDEICRTKHRHEVFSGEMFLADDKCISVVKYILGM